MKKKILITFISLVMGFGTFVNDYSISSKKIETVNASDIIGEEEKLYYGYNVTSGKDLLEQDSLQTSFPIIDANAKYNGKTYNEYTSKVVGGSTAEFAHITGSSFKEVNEQYASSIGAGVYGKIYTVDTNLDTAFDTSTALSNKYTEYYDLYSATISRYYYVVQLTTKEIKNFLTASFKNDLNSIKSKADALNVISKYGTHLNTGYIFGGKMNFTNYQTTTSTTKNYTSATTLDQKLSTAIGKVTAGENASFAEQYSSIENTSTNSSAYKFKSYGGKATSAFTLDSLFTYNSSLVGVESSGFMYTVWINSINNDVDLSIIGIPSSAQSIPLWSLLENTSVNAKKKEYLQKAYIELCGNKYEEYQNKYKELYRDDTSVESEEIAGVCSTLNGLYVKNNEYFYYVDLDMYKSDKFFVSQNQYLYLDLEEQSTLENITYDCSNCELIDKKNAIFKVTGTSGNKTTIKASYGKNTTQILFSANIRTNDFEMGYGTTDYPYVITTKDHFNNIRNDLTASYILYNDIDYSGETLQSFGTFSGTLNGNYFTLKNVIIKENGINNYGLFENNTGTIKNLKIINSGTSNNNAGFEEGGVNYRTDIFADDVKENGGTKNDNYSKNSCSALNAGIIVGTNSGTIENCYIENCYIRNVSYVNYETNNQYATNSCATFACGLISGKNTGTIKNSKVSNSRILNSYYNQNFMQETNIVTTGGITGLLESGTIQGCYFDSGNEGTLFSQNVSRYNSSDGGLLYSLAAGLSGYATGGEIKNSYSYGRADSIDVSYRTNDGVDNGGWLGIGGNKGMYNDPKEYTGLRNNSVIIGKGSSVTISYTYGYTDTDASNDSLFIVDAIEISGTNGNNTKGSGNTSCYLTKGKVTSEKISSTSRFGNSSSSYYHDGNGTIKHILENDRSNYIKLELYSDEDTQMKKEFYIGEKYKIEGIKVKQSINNAYTDDLVYFKLNITDNGNDFDFVNNSFDESATGKYKVKISLDDKVKTSDIDLTTKDNTLVRIYVKDNDYTAYYDQIDEYISNFGYDDITLIAVYTNGDEVEITQDGIINSKYKLTLVTSDEGSYTTGNNAVYITYGNGNDIYKTGFILKVEKRDISSLEVLQNPTTVTYQASSTVDITGLELKINYSDGSSKIISGKDLNDLEIIGNEIAAGDSQIAVCYEDYTNIAYIDITVEDEYTIQFVDYDNKVISSETYHYGDTVTLPSNPTRVADETYTYEFEKWDKDIELVTGDATYKAIYTPTYIDYTVTFNNYDGKKIITSTYHYGETVVTPSTTPTKASDEIYNYFFKGWNEEVTTVTGNKTYVAQYEAKYVDYTVKFVNYDDSEISTKTYHYGEEVTLPTTPTKASDETYIYTFAGWDKEVSSVTGDVTYKATYTKTAIADIESNKIAIELVNMIDNETDIDLGTYSVITYVQNNMSKLNDTDRATVTTKLNALIDKYTTYVQSINNEYAVAEQIEKDYFAPVFVAISYMSVGAFMLLKGKRWF